MHCFLQYVRETWEKQGRNYLENKFYSKLFNKKNPKLERERFRHSKALIVLDDVDIKENTYLEGIINQPWFGWFRKQNNCDN